MATWRTDRVSRAWALLAITSAACALDRLDTGLGWRSEAGGHSGAQGAAADAGAGGSLGGNGSSAGGSVGSQPRCALGYTECETGCVSLETSNDNCGACGVECSSGMSCVDRKCSCPEGLTACSDQCVDVTEDRNHCGECGKACAVRATCLSGVCECDEELVLCGLECVDLSSDGNHCGSCDNMCPGEQLCSQAECGDTCADGETGCGNSCVSLNEDEGHCGECDNACLPGQTCDSGVCACSDGDFCDGECVDTTTDNNHCGSCGTTCTGGQSCQGGQCTCPSGQQLCASACTDTSSDVANCGTCGQECADGANCSGSVCEAGTGGTGGAAAASGGTSPGGGQTTGGESSGGAGGTGGVGVGGNTTGGVATGGAGTGGEATGGVAAGGTSTGGTATGGATGGTSTGGTATGGATGGTSTGGAATGGVTPIEGPCDIYAAANTPCVAAYSMVRTLSSTYTGPLYQVRSGSSSENTGSGGTTHDIGMTADGFADAAAQDAVCNGTTCTVSLLYDQSGNDNHLPVAKAGRSEGGTYAAMDDFESIADAGPLTVGGREVYSLYMAARQGYRVPVGTVGNNMPLDQEPQGIYMLADGTHWGTACCWDFGNVSPDPTTYGVMNTLFFGKAYWGRGEGGENGGPWFGADFEAGVWMGGTNPGDPGSGALDTTALPNENNPSLPVPFALGFLKTDENNYALRMAATQTASSITTAYQGGLPKDMTNEGGIVLGVGGDNSNNSWGTFFEGAIVSGWPTDAAELTVMQNIQSVGYGQ